MIIQDNIIALATASGIGAIAVLRISGPDAISICNNYFQSIHNKDLRNVKSHSIHLGHIIDGNRIVDEVLVSVFKGPNSYTGENVVEISCHGSSYIQQEILKLFLANGCRLADPGEYTLRAFIHGKMDLSQAEAVADLIASNSQASHQIAMQQMRGGFSNELQVLRKELIDFASLIELELDFSGEDVEFADRNQFKALVTKIEGILKRLLDSFSFGNAMKNGIPIAIIGAPNVGKSTLLNALLNEEKAIVSDIAGTTRDAIEDELVINGVVFRFIDTAGIRATEDVVENIGIQKTFEKAKDAQLLLYLFDAKEFNMNNKKEIEDLQEQFPDKKIQIIANKVDQINASLIAQIGKELPNAILLSAKNKDGISILKDSLLELVNLGTINANETIVSNSRHYEALYHALESIHAVQTGIAQNIPSDLIAIDIREGLRHLGTITGAFDVDEDILGNIFANFCIGK